MENFYQQIKNIESKLPEADKILIIGKGVSVFQADLMNQNAIVINVQDSEHIIPGHIGIINSEWAWESVKENFMCDLYLSQINPYEWEDVVILPHVGNNYEEILNDELNISDYLFVTAYEVAKYLNRDKHREIYFIGFDFFEKQKPVDEASPHSHEFNKLFLQMQKSVFKHMMEQNELEDVHHVGNLEFSTLTMQQFNEDGDQGVNLNELYDVVKRRMSEGHTMVVAEFTNNHIGDPVRIREMVRLAAESGADIIKVQKRNVDTFYTDEQKSSKYTSPFGDTLEDYRRAVELDDAKFQILIDACNEFHIPWFASILDYESFQYMLKFNPRIIKLPSTISNHRNYLKQVAQEFSGDIVVSTGFTDQEYENFVLETFDNGERDLFLLQCTSAYPAPDDACNIGVVRHYSTLAKTDHWHLIPGFSSHDFGSLGCQLAVAAGAKMIEKHVKLGNLDWVHFDAVAIDLTDGSFKKFVDDIRKAEVMTGSEKKQVHEKEHHKYIPNENSN